MNALLFKMPDITQEVLECAIWLLSEGSKIIDNSQYYIGNGVSLNVKNVQELRRLSYLVIASFNVDFIPLQNREQFITIKKSMSIEQLNYCIGVIFYAQEVIDNEEMYWHEWEKGIWHIANACLKFSSNDKIRYNALKIFKTLSKYSTIYSPDFEDEDSVNILEITEEVMTDQGYRWDDEDGIWKQ
jgi:hypothetical protein